MNFQQPRLFSVLMPAYNAQPFIGQSIESVVSQSYPHWELIVVNDGSTDNTAGILSKYNDPRIIILNQENAGESAARNTALSQANGVFIAFLDADDEYLPNHLEDTVAFFENNPQYSGVYTDGYYIDTKGNRLQTLASRRRGPYSGDIFEQVVYSSNVFGPPACVVLNHDVIKKHDLRFDENIVIGPDWDFLTQYAEIAPFGYVDNPTVLYRIHTYNISTQLDPAKRAYELAKCRRKAINMERFNECSLHTRQWVFHDLLVNLLQDHPLEQMVVINSSVFGVLPKKSQARILRFMASSTMLFGESLDYIPNWLQMSRDLNPADWRSQILLFTYSLNPNLCRSILRMLKASQVDPVQIPPFIDVNITQG